METKYVSHKFPPKLKPLFRDKARYKVVYGGRGSAKSWTIARALLLFGIDRPIRVLCAREVQKTIKDSVHRLVCDQIEEMGLQSHYRAKESEITSKLGGVWSFVGLRHTSKESLKSYEGFSYCWVEEAQTVSKSSWETLIPTIRTDDAEIWISFNPELETDETYRRFVLNSPPNTIAIKCNWQDNPWFPDVLRQEKDYLEKTDKDAWLNVWEGHCRNALEGAVYAKELRLATEEERITRVPYNSELPVDVWFDLGFADSTSIWFAQIPRGTGEFRLIDFYENSQEKMLHYANVMREKGYNYGTVYMPHDAENVNMIGRTPAQLMRSVGFKVQIVPRATLEQGIQAARAIFSRCYFDSVKCSDGINNLRRYRYEIDPETKQLSKKPLHDECSHAADAFRYLAMSIQEARAKPRQNYGPDYQIAGGWMA